MRGTQAGYLPDDRFSREKRDHEAYVKVHHYHPALRRLLRA